MTVYDDFVSAWNVWLDLVLKKKRGEYVNDRTLKDARDVVMDSVEKVIVERHRGG